ncbi:MAG: cupin domain-containing protein [Roseburia sp.]|nr:cupin domain-containing protein [Roseburia sp.]
MNNEIYRALRQSFEIIEKSHLVLPAQSTLEIYHHYGIEDFNKTGAVFINVVNKEYCKSYAVILPGQSYPLHYHKIKLETFYVLYGELEVTCEENTYILKPGEMLDVERGAEHSFCSATGAVFEEISTTYVRNDSIYIDSKISGKTYEQRKTFVTYAEWRGMKENEQQRKDFTP